MTHEQDQFLEVIDRDEAERRFRAVLSLAPLAEERIALQAALGRVLARDVAAEVDVPSFDRSNVDGFALCAADTFGASEQRPREVKLLPGEGAAGSVPSREIDPGLALAIATGGMLPRGADAVVMVEHTDIRDGKLLIRRAVAPGAHVAFAGTDIAAGEIVVRRGALLTSRETGVLAAVGAAIVPVVRRPRVAILSTGDELIPPGEAMRPALVYDSNARILADAVLELGGEPVSFGIVADDAALLATRLCQALAECDVALLSGGTSKGGGDVSYRVVRELTNPGIVAHGVALKPGKPICLAVSHGKPVVVLPGFPTSAVFTFHEFVAPVIRALAGRPSDARGTVAARLAVKVNSEIGRTEYLLVGLVDHDDSEKGPRLTAFPMGQGSGSVTSFSRADGFVTINRHEEIVEAGSVVAVQLLGREWKPADLVVIGSHCLGLDFLLSQLSERKWNVKFLAVGSSAGLAAAERGQCDLAGIHLLDPATGRYNELFISPGLRMIRGYGRRQGILFRRDDPRCEGKAAAIAVEAMLADPRAVMVNRNAGSGTRILLDGLLAGRQPRGYAVQAKNHRAVAAAIVQGRADWGMAIASAAEQAGLGFLPYRDEEYDLAGPASRWNRPAVVAFRELLAEAETRAKLKEMGFALER